MQCNVTSLALNRIPHKMSSSNNNHNNFNAMEASTTTTTTTAATTGKVSPAAKKTLLLLSCIMYVIGGCGGPLITRLYFLHGGERLWLASFIQMAGFPFMVPVLVILYFIRRKTKKNKTTLIYMRARLFFGGIVIGIIIGVDSYLYSYGFARLPVSTSSLIISAQLAFMAFFAFLLVKQRFTPYSTNAIVLLTIGAGVLAMHTSSDRPAGESNKDYMIGFFMTLAAAVVVGFMMPLIELMYNKAKQTVTFTLVMEFQFVLCLTASIFCTIGMLVNNDFKVIPREAANYELGKTKYYTVLCIIAIFWQCNYLGAFGVIFCSSSLLSGIIGTVLLPITEVLAVVFYKESFKAEKGVSLVLSLWGFASYFYGEYKLAKKSQGSIQPSQQSIDLAQTN